ncbi:hypothetical protein PCCS19_07400 [Paenibacillus sp. CCS19]|uniref:hypothetical protein n=1 Tax=Paenibacillus sp. CCS19 TaxID=3158387 RepID=UPI00256E32DB|nr:hypothetical protein [Paenibacillus cellulosilyticus]GMK37686.1 hypothetical protein PCCS19_07400 [Paenibacillus cellulosilyticus]
MAVIFKRIGNTAIFSADAETKTKYGILEVNFVETERVAQGIVSGVLQISLKGKPLVVVSSSGKPKKCGCDCKSKGIRQRIQVYDRSKLRELGPALALVFRKLSSELSASRSRKSSAEAAVPCFIRVPLCRLAYSQYIVACRLRGRNAQECLQEAEAIYNNCKGNC